MMKPLKYWLGLIIGLVLIHPNSGFSSPKELSIVKIKTAGANDGVYLGAFLQPLDRTLRKALKLDSKNGVLIVDIMEDSPAEKAGLKEDDIIIKADGKNVRLVEDLKRILAEKKIGDVIKLDIIRDKSTKSFTVKLEKAQAKDADVMIWNTFAKPIDRCLGLEVTDMDENLAPYFQVTKDAGALVLHVEPQSPAEDAGIKSGDVITKVNEEKITSVADLKEVFADLEAADSVKIALIRKNVAKTLVAAVAEDCWDDKAIQMMPDLWHQYLPGAKIDPEALKFKIRKPFFSPNDQELDNLKKEMKKLKSEMEELKKELKKQ